jgi:hypothetical protein
MNENNKSFYPSDMFEFIHHPEYGCRDLKGLISYKALVGMQTLYKVIIHLQ